MPFVYDDYRETFKRHEVKRPRKSGPIIAWDLETDPIPKAVEVDGFSREDVVRGRAQDIMQERRAVEAPVFAALRQYGGKIIGDGWHDLAPHLRKRAGRYNLDLIADAARMSTDDVLDFLIDTPRPMTLRRATAQAREELAERLPLPRETPKAAYTVGLRYITVHGANIRESKNLMPFGDDEARSRKLAEIFMELFATCPRKSRFVAWNANRFDTLFLLRSLVAFAPDYDVRPMEAKQGGLRGARVISRHDPKAWWDLCDGIAMTGIQSTLADFTKKFASDKAKLEGVIDFDKESFDPENERHIAYAERDSEALYLAMTEVERIVVELTGRQLCMTIGALGIRYFEANIPEGVGIRPAPEPLWDDLFRYGMRGGYVFVSRQHDGPAWQYDINQAYAAAMRDEPMPAGSACATDGECPGLIGFYHATVSRSPLSPIPFYCKSTDDGSAVECYGASTNTYINTTEIRVLREHGWTVVVRGGWVWTKTFTMEEMVRNLERLRTTHADGPNGPVGTVCKFIGNNAYGKTAERLDKRVLVLSAGGKPDMEIAGACTGWTPHEKWLDGDPAYTNFWVCFVEEVERRRYHRPHVAAFITAHVRMKLYADIMKRPEAFLKADTDSLTFDAPVTHLDVDAKRYGAMKAEYEGVRMIVVGKKVYAVIGEGPANKVPVKAVCKGLRVRELTTIDFERWVVDGSPPIQSQVQMLGWRRGLPSERYRPQIRRGTNFRKTAPHLFGKKAA